MKKILVVDDDTSILEVVEIILSGQGFNVSTHASGLGVPEVVDKYKPDLILLDILLPHKMGTEICKELKETHTIPILLFSAHSNIGAAYKECNADGFIKKPFDVPDFIATIKSLTQ